MKYCRSLLIVALVLISTSVFAAESTSVFRTQYKIAPIEMAKPTVASVLLPTIDSYGIAILENETEAFQPYLRLGQLRDQFFSSSDHSALIGSASNLFDNDSGTTAEFDLDRDQGVAFIEVRSNQTVELVDLALVLDGSVALPHELALSAWVNGNWKTVIARKEIKTSRLSFPNTTSDRWRIEMWHAQPLRLKEIHLFIPAQDSKSNVEIRWLARPEMSYTIFTDAQVYPSLKLAEKGKLEGDELEVIDVNLGGILPNPAFVEPDDDGDGIPNYIDNCVSIANQDQADIDNNGAGDACEDFDGDNVSNSKDNCPDHPNRNQADDDGDGLGDVCDGEESRLTERNKWLPWAAMGLTALIVLLVVGGTIKKK